jgi:hypothetical protein
MLNLTRALSAVAAESCTGGIGRYYRAQQLRAVSPTALQRVRDGAEVRRRVVWMPRENWCGQVKFWMTRSREDLDEARTSQCFDSLARGSFRIGGVTPPGARKLRDGQHSNPTGEHIEDFKIAVCEWCRTHGILKSVLLGVEPVALTQSYIQRMCAARK